MSSVEKSCSKVPINSFFSFAYGTCDHRMLNILNYSGVTTFTNTISFLPLHLLSSASSASVPVLSLSFNIFPALVTP